MNFKSFAKRCVESITNQFADSGPRDNADNCTLYLHIGMPKTGSSAIQRFLYENSAVLREREGVYYPETALHWSQHVPIVKAVVSPMFEKAQFNPFVPEVNITDWLDDLINSCKVNDYKKVILSSEFFWAAPAMQSSVEYHEDSADNFHYFEQVIEQYRTLFSWFKTIKVIVYLRKQDEWLESFYNQQIKNGFTVPSEGDLLQVKNYLLYSKYLQLWERYFGPENIIVKVYEDATHDLINDFCKAVSIKVDDTLCLTHDRTVSSNTRLSPRATGIMKRALEKDIEKDFMELLREVLQYTSAAIVKCQPSAKQNIFSDRFHQRVNELYKDDNIKLSESYPVASRYLNSDETPTAETNSETFIEQLPEYKVEKLLESFISSIN
jgi:hypothetical protein